jgi:hypothetical protein
METIAERVAGLGVHRDTVVACVRAPGPGGRRESHVHQFATTTTGLVALGDWPRSRPAAWRRAAHAGKPVSYAREAQRLDEMLQDAGSKPSSVASQVMGVLPRRRSCAPWWPAPGICPGQHESAGRQRRGTTGKGPRVLHQHLTQPATAASRTKGHTSSAQYARMRGRHGGARATIAAAHSILVAVFHILERGTPDEDLAQTGSSAAARPSATPAGSSTSHRQGRSPRRAAPSALRGGGRRRARSPTPRGLSREAPREARPPRPGDAIRSREQRTAGSSRCSAARRSPGPRAGHVGRGRAAA